MSEINKQTVLDALKKIQFDNSGLDVVSSGIIGSIIVRGNNVGFTIEAANTVANENLRIKCEEAVKSLDGIGSVSAVLTSEIIQSNHPSQNEKQPIKGVKNIILVASGKGGVGKSTLSVGIAKSFQKAGYKTGIADVDIYGPSIPHMLNITGKPEAKDGLMVAKEKDGLKAMSIGFIISEGTAAVWRASMAIKAMVQILRGTIWGELDYLVVDMPPGTGDIQLSIAKYFPVKGAILVSTPQEIALLDVKKAADMFKKVDVPILGVIENMSYFEDPVSGNKNYIFGQGGARKFASDYGLPFLAEVPLNPSIRENADKGVVTDFIDISNWVL